MYRTTAAEPEVRNRPPSRARALRDDQRAEHDAHERADGHFVRRRVAEEGEERHHQQGDLSAQRAAEKGRLTSDGGALHMDVLYNWVSCKGAVIRRRFT